jgi:hypothetical protein
MSEADASGTDADPAGGVAFTIATIVNDRGHYREMRASFAAGGFAEPICEYLSIDNTSNPQTSAYQGFNELLNAARGRYVILCHQDVRLIGEGRRELEQRLAELEQKDPAWALAGNAGGVCPGKLALRISDPHGHNRRVGHLPQRVTSLDENFIVVKRAARIGFSRDLSGFHFYGADICLVADILGHSAYVIDFHLQHLSGGTKGPSFHAAEEAFRAKWTRALRSRWIQTTCSLVNISGPPLGQLFGRIVRRPLAHISKRIHQAHGWTPEERVTPPR